MFKQMIFVFLAVVAIVAAAPAPEAKAEAKPDPLVVAASPIAYSAPLISAPVVTATSSQAIVRNYNGLAYSAPLIAASPYAAYSAYSAYSPYAAYPSAAYVASPYTAGFPVVV